MIQGLCLPRSTGLDPSDTGDLIVAGAVQGALALDSGIAAIPHCA